MSAEKKKKVSAADLVPFAIDLEGETLKTLHRSADFRLEIKGDGYIYTPRPPSASSSSGCRLLRVSVLLIRSSLPLFRPKRAYKTYRA